MAYNRVENPFWFNGTLSYKPWPCDEVSAPLFAFTTSGVW